tara:strand:+ start:828 stop:1064 length:237 start_codon:yes stop_codon:yes gene_type:complete
MQDATNQMPQPKLDLSTAEDIKCDECENNTFMEVIIIKKVSAIMSPTGQDIMAPIKTFQCAKCNHLNEQFVPKVDQLG